MVKTKFSEVNFVLADSSWSLKFYSKFAEAVYFVKADL